MDRLVEKIHIRCFQKNTVCVLFMRKINIQHTSATYKKEKIEIKVDQEDYMVTMTFLAWTSKPILSSNNFLQLSNEQVVPSLL